MILAIDLGSTSFKAALFGDGLERLGGGACRLTYAEGPGGRVELAPQHVLDAVGQAIAAAMDGHPAESVQAVAIASQAQTFTVVDGQGRPLIPFVSWLDTRSAEACRSMEASGAFRDIAAHVTFPALLPALEVCQLRRLRDEHPALLDRPNGALQLAEFVVMLLTGAPVNSDNLAAMGGLYSMADGAWWPVALEACGLDADPLARIVPVGRSAGLTCRAAPWGVPAGIAVVLAGNDQTAGAYGAAVHERDAVLITLGTCQVAYRCPAGSPSADRTVAAGPYPGGLWYAMAADVCGGSLINWAESVLEGCGTDESFFAAADAASPGCRGLVFEIGPEGRDRDWRGLTDEHTAGDRARAVVEALVRRMKRLLGDLVGEAMPETVLVAGGGTRARLWVTLLEEAIGRPLTVTDADPLAGAARMARSVLVGPS